VHRRGREIVEVRRSGAVFALLGLGAWMVAGAYAWRGLSGDSAGAGGWLVVAMLTLIGLGYGLGAWDSRLALLVADDQGVRFRSRRSWTGVPWREISAVTVLPRPSVLRNGRVEIETADARSLLIPLGVSSLAIAEDLAASLRTLAPTSVVVAASAASAASSLRPAPAPLAAPAAEVTPEPQPPSARPQIAVRAVPSVVASSARRAIRANLTRPGPSSVGSTALQPDPQPLDDPLPEIRELVGTRRGVDLDFARVGQPTGDRPRHRPAVALDAAPVEAWPTQAAADPVIGNRLRAARELSGITVDGLATRTHIRPHVIEAMEVDDFTPCGGDFYARGHIRSLTRVLGLDGETLITLYDDTYAHAPIEARKVFEAELATGPRPSIRLTSGGPNWAALLGVVMVIAIVWGLGNLLTGRAEAPASTATPPVAAPQADQPAGPADIGPATVNAVVLKGRAGDTAVVVRDGDRTVVWKGTVTAGDVKRLSVDGRVRIVSDDAGAVRARVNGKDKGRLGADGERGRIVLGRS